MTHPDAEALPPRVRISSELPLPPEVVWARVTTMEGVNDELQPWLRMSVPSAFAGRSLAEAESGQALFGSWLLAGGVLPFDLHSIRMERVEPLHFVERSSSWMQRVWRHERWVEPTDAGCRITDDVRFASRLGPMGALARPLVQGLFEHRHQQLRRWAASVR